MVANVFFGDTTNLFTCFIIYLYNLKLEIQTLVYLHSGPEPAILDWYARGDASGGMLAQDRIRCSQIVSEAFFDQNGNV